MNREMQLMYDLQKLYKEFFDMSNIQYGRKKGGGVYIHIDREISGNPRLIRLVDTIKKHEQELKEMEQ